MPNYTFTLDVQQEGGGGKRMRNDTRALDDLLSDITDSDDVVSENAIYLIGEIGAEAVVLKTSTLKTDSQLKAINCLCHEATRIRVIDCLIAAGMAGNNPWLKGNVAEALGKIGDIYSEPFLVGCLDDDDQIVRSSAADALGLIGDSSVMEGLAGALRDAEWGVRLAATRSVGIIGGPQAADLLRTCLRDARADVRIVAEDALELLGVDSGRITRGAQ